MTIAVFDKDSGEISFVDCSELPGDCKDKVVFGLLIKEN